MTRASRTTMKILSAEGKMAKKDAKAKRGGKVLRIRDSVELPSHKQAASLDDLDRAILEKHQEDVSFLFSELAEKFDVTVATIRNRIKRLKSSGVMDVILVMNPYKIGYNSFSVIGIRVNPDADLERIVSTLLSMPGVTNLVLVTGRYDIFLHYVCQNMEDFRQFVVNDLRLIPGIASFESFIGLDLYERKFELGIIG